MCVSPHLALLSGFHQSLAGGHTALRLDPITGHPGSPIPVSFCSYMFTSSGYREQQTLTNSRHSLTNQPVGHLPQDVTSHGKRRSPLCFRDQCGSESKQWQTVPYRWRPLSVPISNDSRAGVCRQRPAYQGGPGPEPPTHWPAAQLTSALMPTLSCRSLQR